MILNYQQPDYAGQIVIFPVDPAAGRPTQPDQLIETGIIINASPVTTSQVYGSVDTPQ